MAEAECAVPCRAGGALFAQKTQILNRSQGSRTFKVFNLHNLVAAFFFLFFVRGGINDFVSSIYFVFYVAVLFQS